MAQGRLPVRSSLDRNPMAGMNESPDSPCPSEAQAEAFMGKRLEVSERAAFLEHLAHCPRCRARVSAMGDGGDLDPRVVRHALPFRPRLILALAVAAAAVGAAIFLAVPLADRLHGNTGVDALEKAVPERRPIEARLTGFGYHPMSPVRSEQEPVTDDEARNWRLLNAASRIQESASRNPSIENLHALGVSRLLLGQTSAAVNALEQALATETGQKDPHLAMEASRNAALLNDLAAALATDSMRTHDASAGELALRAAECSWKVGKTSEAAWNRAVALEAARGRRQSETAWLRYLTIDTSSPWAAEAQARAQAAGIE